MAEKWGISERKLENAAIENAAVPLSEVKIEISDVDGKGHMLGSFLIGNKSLTGACLFAPGMAAKAGGYFVMPIYAVIPNEQSWYF